MRHICICMDETGGRCPEDAVETPKGAFICIGHLREESENLKIASEPDGVLVKFSGKESFLKYLQENYPELEKKDHDEYELNRQHGEYAKELGRNPHRYDKRRNDDGVPVFGKEGVQNVGSLDDVLAEIWSCGYSLANVHWFPRLRPNERRNAMVFSAVLVFGFVLDRAHKVDETKVRGGALVAEMTSSAWQFVHVFANPPRVNGEILHTVNCAGRQECQGDKSKNVLKFLNSLWYCLPREADDGTVERQVSSFQSKEV